MTSLKLHLACWKRYIPGFIHIDQADFEHLDYKASIDQLPMFMDNTVDLIYCSHALEYFDRQKAVHVLKEWHRVLKTGATLRVAVPDFEALVHVYTKYASLDKILGPLYGRMEIETPQKKVIYHQTTYDFNSLRKLLEENGFGNVHRYNWQDTIHKHYDDHSQAYIPHMDKENGLLISLNMECVKI